MAAHGPRLTPAQVATLAATYAATGSYAEAARSIGRDDASVARKALLRLGSPSESHVHARACASGLSAGRRRLNRCIRLVGDQLATELAAGSMEPKDSASLARALATMVQAFARVDERRDSGRTERLRRAKIRSEIRALEREGGLTVDAIVEAINGLSRAEKEKLRDALKGAPVSTPPAPTGAPPAAG